jgi:uncharacterized protein (TIGR00290 family)
MDLKKKVTISWSGGKDSAFALYRILHQREYDVVSLHTVINADNRRVGLHGVPEDLIAQQAAALGLRLEKIYLTTSDQHGEYETLMTSFYDECSRSGIQAVVFGDIFLEDLKTYREKLLAPSGLTGIFPLWGIETTKLMREFIDAGFKTLICAADKKYFSAEEMGRTIDGHFVTNLPAGVDPCGENGEFHTFVYDGPIFHRPVLFEVGEVVERSYSYKMTDSDGSLKTAKSCFLFKDLH